MRRDCGFRWRKSRVSTAASHASVARSRQVGSAILFPYQLDQGELLRGRLTSRNSIYVVCGRFHFFYLTIRAFFLSLSVLD